MDLEFEASGEITERQELLNGTRTVAFEAVSEDGGWTVTGVVAWNLGLVEFPGEGDVTIAGADGSEVYATLERAAVRGGNASDEDGTLLDLRYEVDGGSGALEGVRGGVVGWLRVGEGGVRGGWRLEIAT